MDHQTLWLVKGSCCLVVGNQRSLWFWQKKVQDKITPIPSGLSAGYKNYLKQMEKWQYKVNVKRWVSYIHVEPWNEEINTKKIIPVKDAT